MYDIDQLFEDIPKGCRRSLSRAITLVESNHPDHQELANQLLSKILKHRSVSLLDYSTRRNDYQQYARDQAFIAEHSVRDLTQDMAPQKEANTIHSHKALPPALFMNNGRPKGNLRIGLSGNPGAGKSSLIETFGLHLINKYGLRVAVLSVDPSSSITGGSLLGDKTRMRELSANSNAYIRPTPSKGILGGIAETTNEVATLCNHAGYDVVLIESVGVGQSEHTVSQVSDILVMLIGPSNGDSIQGIKKGLLEFVDLICVTKCDGDLVPAHKRTLADYSHAMKAYTTRAHMYGWSTRVLGTSVVEDKERFMDNLWGHILKLENVLSQPMHTLSTETIDSLGLKIGVEYNIDMMKKFQKRHNDEVEHEQQQQQESTTTSSSTTTPTTNQQFQPIQETPSFGPTLLDLRRASQRVEWMKTQIDHMVDKKLRLFMATDDKQIPTIEKDLIFDHITPRYAAIKALNAYVDSEVDKRIQMRDNELL